MKRGGGRRGKEGKEEGGREGGRDVNDAIGEKLSESYRLERMRSNSRGWRILEYKHII
mgnify:FL=1